MARTALLIGLVTAGALACGDSNERTAQAASPEPPARPARVAVTPQPVSVVEPPAETTGPVNPVSWTDAETAYRERRYVDAVELFSGYVEREPDSPWGHYMLGLSAWKSGEHERALTAFDEALRLDSNHVKSLLNLSRVLLERERPEEARERIERALTVDPESDDAFRLLGVAQSDLGEVDAAVESYHTALILDSADAWSMNNLGLALIQKERFGEALLPLARAVRLRSDVPVFQNNLGIALERTGHFGAAVAAYRAALDADQSHAKATANLARLDGRPDATTVAIDLAAYAQEFAQEIAGWHTPTVATPVPLRPPRDTIP